MVADAVRPPPSFRNATGFDRTRRSVIAWHPDDYDVIDTGERGGRVSR
jgi:hypothetical protein